MSLGGSSASRPPSGASAGLLGASRRLRLPMACQLPGAAGQGAAGRPYALTMDGRRTALLTDIDRWVVAARALAATLTSNIDAVTTGRRTVEEEGCLLEAVATMSTAERFLRMNVALAEFDMARFRLRSSLISAALAEGLSEEQLVGILGVPAELAEQVLDGIRSTTGHPAP